MQNHALCIDFGAAYTKVAVRRMAGEQGHLLRHPSLNLDALNACIPTVAACRERDNRWVFGVDAVDLVEGNGVRIYRNWKKELFAHRNGIPKGAGEVTFQFFRWLHDDFLRDAVREIPSVRVCVPDYVLGTPLAKDMEQIVHEAGWTEGSVVAFSEPVANILGVLTGGVNRLVQDEVGDFPDLRTMFADSGLLRSIRRQAAAASMKPDVQGTHSILAVDTGAFTTDFALARFNLHRLEAPPEIYSASVNLGISDLDGWVAKEFPRAKSQYFLHFTTREMELFRRRLYSEKIPYVLPDSREIGEGWEMNAVQGCIHRFAGEIYQALGEFVGGHRVTQVQEAILTGGGNHVPGLVLRLAEGLLGIGAKVIHLPIAVTPLNGAQFNEMLEEVVRGGSALGGVSIVTDAWKA